jgi:hypothetical protein
MNQILKKENEVFDSILLSQFTFLGEDNGYAGKMEKASHQCTAKLKKNILIQKYSISWFSYSKAKQKIGICVPEQIPVPSLLGALGVSSDFFLRFGVQLQNCVQLD